MTSAKSDCTDLSEIRLSFHDSIKLANREKWESIVKQGPLYLGYEHLEALEDRMADRVSFHYVIFHCEKLLPFGVAYYQSVNFVDNGSEYSSKAGELAEGIGKRLLKDMKVRCLINGNAYHTGTFGFFFKEDVELEQQLSLIASTTKTLMAGKHVKPRASVSIIKEFAHDLWENADEQLGKYHRLHLDVNMVLHLRSEWNSMNDYLAALNTKARNRLNNINRKSDELEVRSLNADEIFEHAKRISALFMEVLEGAPYGFDLFNTDVYSDWKRCHGDRLLFLGYFLNDKLVGFNAAFDHAGFIDAHYVGFDHGLIKSHLIYQRMLSDLVKEGIDRKSKKVVFGRTAEVAKSSFGAVPEQLMLYIRYRNSIGNQLIKPLISSITPGEFELRDPMKKQLS